MSFHHGHGDSVVYRLQRAAKWIVTIIVHDALPCFYHKSFLNTSNGEQNVMHLKRVFSIFCALSQNYQYLYLAKNIRICNKLFKSQEIQKLY